MAKLKAIYATKSSAHIAAWHMEIRRTKCDEKRPQCSACVRHSFECDFDSRGKDTPQSATDLTLGPHGNRLRVIAPSRRERYTNPGRGLSQFPLVRAEEDFQHLQRFLERTAPGFEGYFRDPIWKESIFQACQHSQYILDGVISLAALHRIGDFVQGSHEADRHYGVAVIRYGKSIEAMSKALQGGEDARHHLLIIYCLLSFCFEAWSGSLGSAIDQVYRGLNFIQQWVDSKTSALTTTESDLVQLFTRLENSCIISLEHKIDDCSQTLSSRWVTTEKEDMPEVFASVEEARYWHEAIVTCMLDALLKLRNIKIAVMRRAMAVNTANIKEDREAQAYFTDTRKSLVQKFDLWHQSFYPLLHKSRHSHPAWFSGATALELRYWSSSTVLSGTFGLPESAFDGFNINFATAVDLARTLQDHETSQNQRQTVTFTIDGCICPSLYAVAIKCREPRIRAAAIELLEKRPRREGLWDSKLLACVGRVSKDIEEAEGLVDGVVPELSRIVGMRTVKKDLWGRRGSMSYFLMERGTGGTGVIMPVQHTRRFAW
ncbi:hypothetical protein VTL71DRAFT_16149 [Oculimacula yallundae]|uniref:Zn(2)-C6 fungal-type domain-containing protein n=1 Tax=Oculimacula yallundae TaxID=86028 RepID=A0ABR4CDM2_9HELO